MCRYAITEPPIELGHLVSKLRSSVTAQENENKLNTTATTTSSETFFVDRRFRSWDNYISYNNRNTGRNRPIRARRPQGPCYICRRKDYISYNHSQEEQDQQKARFRARNQGRYRSGTSPNARLDLEYKQYVSAFEGVDSEDEFEAQFLASLPRDPESSSPEPEEDATATTFLTSATLLSD